MSTGRSSSKKSLMVFLSTFLLIGLLGSEMYATNGYFAHGYGTRYKAMAGAGVALYLSPLGVATNPAVISFLGRQVYIGTALFNPNREYTVSGNPSGFPGTFPLTPGTVKSDSKWFVVPSAAVSITTPTGLALGLAIYGNGGMNTDYPTKTFDNPQLTFNPPTGVNLAQLFVAGTFAYKFAPNQSIGLTGIFAFQQFKAEGLFAFGGFSSDPTKLTNNGNANSTGFGARVGYLGDFGIVSLGASYQTKISMSEFDKYAGLFAEQGDFDIPANWTVGVAVKATPIITLAADIQKIMYSDIASIAHPLDLQNNSPVLQNGQPNPNFQPLGSDGGWGFGWEDMTVVKIGAQLKPIPGFAVRAGFSTGSQPIPDSEVMFNILAPGVIEKHFTLGFSKALAPKVTLNVAGMYAPSKSVVGPNPFEAPNQQTIELKMNQFEADASVSITL